MNEDRKKTEGEEQLLRLLKAGSDTEPGSAEPAGAEPAGTESGGTEPGSAKPGSTKPAGSAPLGEEDALRDLLRGAVGGIEPSGNALERLRYAVPARRVRKRRVLVAASIALLVGTSVPAGMALTSGTGGNDDRSTMAGQGKQDGNAKDGSGLHQNGSGSRPKPKKTSDKGKDKDAENGVSSPSPSPLDSRFPDNGDPDVNRPAPPVPGATGGPGGGLLRPPAASDVPNCNQNQLGVSGSTRAPSAGGKVYGSFRVTNVSARGCTVRGPETVVAGPATGPAPEQGGAAVAVVRHVTGDPATGLLPDPSVETLRMVLAPNAEYEVRFAWVPSEQGCPGTGGSEGSTPPEGGSAGSTGADGTTDSGQGAELQKEPLPGVVVSHTPNSDGPDGPTTQMTIAEACGGTVYRTGVIPLG